jgi:hypothetical protein
MELINTEISSNGILKSLLYANIFSCPLTLKEISFYHNQEITNSTELVYLLEDLIDKKLVFKFGKYYSVSNDKSIFLLRENALKLALKKIEVAKIMTKIISCFPFVRSVMLSGSISKLYMKPTSDIDYFIVVQHDRLWISRTLLKLFRFIFLFNSSRNFCLNYFISDNKFEIDEKNFFTANELITLIPLYGFDHYSSLMFNNNWISDYFPNFSRKTFNPSSNLNSPFIKRFCESILSFKFIDKVDEFLMNRMKMYWRNKFPKLSSKDLSHSFKSNKNVSKQHINNYEKKILKEFDLKIKEFEDMNNISIK